MKKVSINYNKSDEYMDFQSERGCLEPKLKKKIRLTVIGIHVGLLLILVSAFLISKYMKDEKPVVIQVKLVSSNSLTSSSMENISSPQPQEVKRRPDPVKSKTKIKRPKIKKPKVKKSTKKKVVKRSKPKKHLLSSKDIIVTKKVIKSEPIKKLTPLPTVDIAKNLTSSYRAKRTKTHSIQGAIASTGNVSQNYADKLFTAIYQIWKQPAKSELHGRRPIVILQITIGTSGSIINSRISQKSGVSVMDYSAKALLKKIAKLPPPPNGKQTFTISLEIID